MTFLSKKVLLIFFLVPIVFACNSFKKNDPVIVNDLSYAKIVALAEDNNKGIILSLNKPGCDACKIFEEHLVKNKKLAENVYQNYIFAKIDEEKSAWLTKLLNNSTFPTFVIIDKHINVKGIIRGSIPDEEFIKKIDETTKKPFTKNFRLSHSKDKSPNKIISYMNTLFKAYLKWDTFKATNDKKSLSGIDSLLSGAIRINPTFYNQYLLSKYYHIKADSSKSNLEAKNALLDTNLTSIFYNHQLYNELKLSLDPKYSPLNEAYLLIKEQDQNIGLVKITDSISTKIKIQNVGKKPLKIRNVFTDCSCTAANWKSIGVIQPGNTAQLTIKIKPYQVGDFSHSVMVFSNGSQGPSNFTIRGITIN